MLNKIHIQVFIVLLFLVLSSSVFAVSRSDVPLGDFSIPGWVQNDPPPEYSMWDLLAVVVAGLLSALIYIFLVFVMKVLFFLHDIGKAVMIVIFIPVFEEVFFRVICLEFIAIKIFNVNMTSAFIAITVIFAVSHALIALLKPHSMFSGAGAGLSLLGGAAGAIGGGVGQSLFTRSLIEPPFPGIQVCEGLFIGALSGMLYLMMRYVMFPPVGIIVSLVFGPLIFHMMINFALVVINVVTNLMGSWGKLIGISLRILLLLLGILFVWQAYVKGVDSLIVEIWFD